MTFAYCPYDSRNKHADKNRHTPSLRRAIRRCFEMYLAGVLVWSAPFTAEAHADGKTNLAWLLNHALTKLNVDVEEVASALTNASMPGGISHLVRWNQSNIVLGLQITKGTARQDVYPIALRLIQAFGVVGRTLRVCLYHEQVGDVPDPDVADPALAPCESNTTDIDLVIDLSNEASPSTYVAHLQNKQAAGNSYRMIWENAISAVAHRPNKDMCGGKVISDDAAQRIVRAAGLVRIPASTPHFRDRINECSNVVSLGILGSVPIGNPGGNGATFSQYLLQLLYSNEFSPGETREDVLAKLKSAQTWAN